MWCAASRTAACASWKARLPDRAPLRILLAMLADRGHHMGAFGLARLLRGRGHHVAFLCLPDLAPLVAAQGFEAVVFAEDVLPPGSLHALPDAPRAERERVFRRFLAVVDEGALDARLRSAAPDVLLCDTFLWHVALRALRLGIRTVSVSIVMSSRPNARVSPAVTDLPPGDTAWSRLRVRVAWAGLRAKYFFTKRVASHVLGAYRMPTRMHHLTHEFRARARRAGGESVPWWPGEFGPRLALPEIILCPRALQWEGEVPDERTWAGHMLDVDRRETALAAPLDASRPLVYCSLGTCATAYPHAARFFAAVAEAARLRPDWQLVLHTGTFPAPATPSSAPNLIVAEEAPQLWLLARAAAMVTHGGLNSILECVHFEVPMLIVPGLRDQPGNAARAVHHRIARTTSMARIDGPTLADGIAAVMADAGLRTALAALRERIRAETGLADAFAIIEGRA